MGRKVLEPLLVSHELHSLYLRDSADPVLHRLIRTSVMNVGNPSAGNTDGEDLPLSIGGDVMPTERLTGHNRAKGYSLIGTDGENVHATFDDAPDAVGCVEVPRSAGIDGPDALVYLDSDGLTRTRPSRTSASMGIGHQLSTRLR